MQKVYVLVSRTPPNLNEVSSLEVEIRSYFFIPEFGKFRDQMLDAYNRLLLSWKNEDIKEQLNALNTFKEIVELFYKFIDKNREIKKHPINLRLNDKFIVYSKSLLAAKNKKNLETILPKLQFLCTWLDIELYRQKQEEEQSKKDKEKLGGKIVDTIRDMVEDYIYRAKFRTRVYDSISKGKILSMDEYYLEYDHFKKVFGEESLQNFKGISFTTDIKYLSFHDVCRLIMNRLLVEPTIGKSISQQYPRNNGQDNLILLQIIETRVSELIKYSVIKHSNCIEVDEI